MLQTQTKILIKDNSGYKEGKIINFGIINKKQQAKIGNIVKAVMTRLKTYKQLENIKSKSNKRKKLNDLLIIQTKKQMLRYDGSTLKYDKNSGVCISVKQRNKQKKLQLLFSRINTSVPYELRNYNNWQRFKGSYNIIKLAKDLF